MQAIIERFLAQSQYYLHTPSASGQAASPWQSCAVSEGTEAYRRTVRMLCNERSQPGLRWAEAA